MHPSLFSFLRIFKLKMSNYVFELLVYYQCINTQLHSEMIKNQTSYMKLLIN